MLVVFAGPPPPDVQPPVPGEGGGANTGGQQTGVAIQRLPAPTPVTIAADQSFSDLVAQQLGNFGTGADGFDGLFNLPASRFGIDLPALSIFDATLAAADALGPTFDPAGFSDIDALLNLFFEVGDTFFGSASPEVTAAKAQFAAYGQQMQSTAATVNNPPNNPLHGA